MEIGYADSAALSHESWLRASSEQLRVARGSLLAPLDLAELWHELALGSLVVRASRYSETHCFLELEQRASRPARLLPGRTAILQRILTGETQKRVAMDSALSASTVAMISTECLHAMGTAQCPSRAPISLIAAAHAARGQVLDGARLSKVGAAGSECWLASCERPDRHMAALLTPAEDRVTRLLIEGRSYAEIAVARSTSSRTVANQLASTFRKLGVSGRCALIAVLIRDRAERSPQLELSAAGTNRPAARHASL